MAAEAHSRPTTRLQSNSQQCMLAVSVQAIVARCEENREKSEEVNNQSAAEKH